MARAATRKSAGRFSGKRYAALWMVLLGLALGTGITLGIQYFRSHAPSGSGLKSLFSAKPEAAESKPVTPAAPAPKPKLDFYTVLPEVETVLPERTARAAKPARPEPAEAGARYMLQAASFASFEEADRLKAKLALSGFEAQIEKVSIEGKGNFFRVRLGPYRNTQDLDTASQKLAHMGIKTIRLKIRKASGG